MHLRANQGVVSMRSSLESYNSLYLYSSKVNQSLANTAALTSGLTEISEDRFDCRSDQNHNDATHSFRHTHRHTHSWGCSKQKESGRAAAVMQLDSLQCYSPPTPLSLILFLCHSLPPLSSFLFSTHTHTVGRKPVHVCVLHVCRQVMKVTRKYRIITTTHETWCFVDEERWRNRIQSVSAPLMYPCSSFILCVLMFLSLWGPKRVRTCCQSVDISLDISIWGIKWGKMPKKNPKTKNTKKPSGYNRC